MIIYFLNNVKSYAKGDFNNNSTASSI